MKHFVCLCFPFLFSPAPEALGPSLPQPKMPPVQRRVLIIGGSFAGLCCGRCMADDFLVTIVVCKESFEYTPDVLRAFVVPKHLDVLTFTLYPVIEKRMDCKLNRGEVTELNGQDRTNTIKPMFVDKPVKVDLDYCIVAAGCNFGVFHQWGESLWFPTYTTARAPKALYGSDADGTGDATPWCVQDTWLLNSFVPVATLTVFLLYWVLVYNGGPVSVLSVLMHGCNFLLIVVDFLLVRLPFYYSHVYMSMVFGVTYALFTPVYYLASNSGMQDLCANRQSISHVHVATLT